GAKNVVADALSRVHGQTEFLQLEVTTLSSELYGNIKQGWNEDSQLKAKLRNYSPIQELLEHFYSGATGGHSKMQATIKRTGALVYWKKIRNQIKQYIRECDIYQRYKPELVPYPRLLQPLRIPTSVWTEISMDFIDGLPMSKGRTIIMVIVDRLRDSMVDDADKSLSAREATIDLLKFHIKRSQNKIKSLADKHRCDREFEEGVWVYLKLQPYRQATLKQAKQNKFSPKYFGPFFIIKKVGKVAYKLQLPSSSHIHHVFHVSQLKLYKG
nr:retrotransposable element Tf2 [Tanacetum cinerariifolium]